MQACMSALAMHTLACIVCLVNMHEQYAAGIVARHASAQVCDACSWVQRQRRQREGLTIMVL
jgi:hypothetical protein